MELLEIDCNRSRTWILISKSFEKLQIAVLSRNMLNYIGRVGRTANLIRKDISGPAQF